MNLKKTKIISIIGIFIMNFISHFIYEIFPNKIFSIFFPINESIWEHMKMLFTSVLLYSIIEYFLLKKNKINFNNFLFSIFISALLIIPIYLIMFLPIYYIIGEDMIIILIIMFISIIIVEIISYYILKSENIKYLNYISLILIITSYLIFGYLTYKPLKNALFFDTEEEKYGIDIYIKKEEP